MLDHLLDLAQNQVFAALAGASVIGGVFYWLRDIPNRIRNVVRYIFSFEVEISNDSSAFEAALFWVTRAVAERWYNRSFKLNTAQDTNDDWSAGDELEAQKKRRWFLAPSEGAHWTRFEGWPVRIHREVTNSQHAANSSVREIIHIRLYSPNRDRLARLIASIREVLNEGVTLDIYSRGLTHWKLIGYCNPRPVDSVITPGDQLGRMISDAKDFLASEAWYGERGIPYRRGWLLTGPPGTGKTSAAMCLAGHLKLPLYVLNIGSMRADSDLIDAVNEMPNRVVLLLEDFDRQHMTEGDEKLTLSAFCNIFDGAMARDGRLMIITANHPEEIDPVLLRPGRIDLTFDFALSGPEEVRALFARFYGREVYIPDTIGPIAASAVQAAMLLHKVDPAAALEELQK